MDKTPAPLPAAVQRSNVPDGHIGYYNHSRSPLTFTSAYANRGPATIEPGKAVRGVDGQLAAYDPDLERMVADGCLKRIMPSDPRYKAFVQETETLTKRQGVVRIPAKDVVVGSDADKSDSKSLKYDTEVVDGTTYFLYDGQRFPSISAMNAYARSKGDL